jgi:site-specific recombinase XerD
MNKHLKDIARAVGIRKKLTFHISRHTFATRFLESGGAIEVLQQLLGHTDIATTMIYVTVSSRRKRQQIDMMR